MKKPRVVRSRKTVRTRISVESVAHLFCIPVHELRGVFVADAGDWSGRLGPKQTWQMSGEPFEFPGALIDALLGDSK